jgi:hypothetical protein
MQGGRNECGSDDFAPPCSRLCGVISQISDLANDTHAQLPQILIWSAITAAYFLGETESSGSSLAKMQPLAATD